MSPLRALARVNVAAIERNVARLRGDLRGGAELCAVVKSDGYGHGAAAAAHAALAGGATWLAVATAGEAAQVRAAGLDGPLLVLGALSPEELDAALAARADVVAWREELVAAVAARGGGRVHVKLDTGMGRLGTRDPEEATRVAEAAAADAAVELVGAMTHFATADELGDGFFGEQLARFEAWALPLRERHPGLILHAANSAALLRDAASHFDLVRARRGRSTASTRSRRMPPPARSSPRWSWPATSRRSSRARRARAPATAGASWPREDTVIATVPIGYGDGVSRALTNNAEVLVERPALRARGDGLDGQRRPRPRRRRRRRRSAATRRCSSAPGPPAEEMARRLGTINYEITCALTARVPRAYHRDGVAL